MRPYISIRDDIVGSAKMLAITDSLVAFVAGLMVLPAIFSFDPNTDPATLSDSSVSMIVVYTVRIYC